LHAAGEYARAKSLPEEHPSGRSQTLKDDRLRQPLACNPVPSLPGRDLAGNEAVAATVNRPLIDRGFVMYRKAHGQNGAVRGYPLWLPRFFDRALRNVKEYNEKAVSWFA
jgi:hypothetical protein